LTGDFIKMEYQDEGHPVFNTDESWVHVKWVPCHHDVAHPQVVNGEDNPQIWRVAANRVNKRSQIANKRWSSSLGTGHAANNSSP
jgi:hypothetical protein